MASGTYGITARLHFWGSLKSHVKCGDVNLTNPNFTLPQKPLEVALCAYCCNRHTKSKIK